MTIKSDCFLRKMSIITKVFVLSFGVFVIQPALANDNLDAYHGNAAKPTLH